MHQLSQRKAEVLIPLLLILLRLVDEVLLESLYQITISMSLSRQTHAAVGTP